MDAFYVRLGRFVVRFRYAIIMIWVVAAVASVAALPTLSSVVKTEQSTFLPSSSPSLKAQKMYLRFNHQSNNLAPLTLVAVLPVVPASPLGRSQYLANQFAVTALERQIRQFPHVVSVQDFGTSPDGLARQALILADVPLGGGGTGDVLITRIRSTFAAASGGIHYHLAGGLAQNYDIQQQTKDSNTMITYLSYAVIIVLLLFAFRALLAPVVTLITAALALLISGPVIAESTHLNVPVSVITEAALIVLLLGAGTDYCVFLLSRMREEIQNGLTPRDAVARAVATVGESITFSAFTIIAALCTLLLAQYGIYQSMGPALAIPIGIMLLAALTLLPALLAVFGRAVFWPAHPRPTREHRDGVWARTAGRLITFPRLTLAVGILLFGGLALGRIGASPTGGFAGSVPSTTDSGKGEQALIAHFPAAAAQPEIAILSFKSSLWLDAQPAATAQGMLSANPLFRAVSGPFGADPFFTGSSIAHLVKTLGPPDRLPPEQPAGIRMKPAAYNAYRALAQFFTPDGKMVQFVTTPVRNNVDNQTDLNDVPALRSAVQAVARQVGADKSGVYGLLPVAYDVSQTSSADMQRLIPIVAVLILLLLAIVLRSLVAPLYLVISVVLSYMAALGLAGIAFVHIVGRPNLWFVLPIVMFIFLMALGSDYNILVMSRIREEAQHYPLAEAVKRAIGATGTTVTTAGLILGGTFAAFGVAAPAGDLGEGMRNMGYGIAAGILLDTFFVRTLLVPAAVVLIGRRNWWPSPLFRREIAPPPPFAALAEVEVRAVEPEREPVEV
jgi:RND superfamily putative drug exporter